MTDYRAISAAIRTSSTERTPRRASAALQCMSAGNFNQSPSSHKQACLAALSEYERDLATQGAAQ
jgi:hypothetical protein